MNEEIKKQWADALRSGKYQQGRGWLRVKDSFCCLGVLCDLHAKATNGAWTVLGQSYVATYKEAATSLPGTVVQWVGWDAGMPNVEYQTEMRSLISLNDALGLSFTEIAEIIEDQL